MDEKSQDEYSPEEIARQIQHGIERSLTMQHKPQQPTKQKKRGHSRKRKLTPRR
jgi:hypothetical protein